MVAVADHEGLGRSDAARGERVGDDVCLGRAFFVQRRAADAVEVACEIKMLEDADGERLGLGGRDDQTIAVCLESGQKGGNAVVDGVFKHTVRDEILAVIGDGLPRVRLVQSVIFHKAVDQRRTDEGVQLALVADLDAALAQRVGDRIGDALAGVGQRAVEVEEEMFLH